MNKLLFLTKDLEPGGIQTVTVFLANALVGCGNQVSIVIFEKPRNDMLRNILRDDIPIYVLSGFSYSRKNTADLRYILQKHGIRVVINQYGLPYIPIKLIRKASKGQDCKVISVYHSDPISNARVLAVENQLKKYKSGLRNKILSIKKSLYSFITRNSMAYVYRSSDSYCLLSDKFVQNFVNFTHISSPQKIVVIPNPVTLNVGEFSYSPHNKKNKILYVGRVETIVKRVDRVLEVWRLLEQKYQDWQLYIVGDGDALENLKIKASQYNLHNIHFEGFQNPIKYYEEASLLLLTSDFEGFGLSLVEGMTFGVVPIAYGSYTALEDIINDGENGFIIKPEGGSFKPENMAIKVSYLMDNYEFRNKMAVNALEISKKFSPNRILSEWNALFEKLI